jgi:hypothetical protein
VSKYSQGFFTPKNPQKYIGKGTIKYRSSWEWAYMNFLDQSDGVLQWASESIHIPYVNPFTGKKTIYVPDFFMIYVDKDGKQHAELVEIKPSKETSLEEAKSLRDRASIALNMCKWEAARKFCKAQGIKFRIVTEFDIFQGKK